MPPRRSTAPHTAAPAWALDATWVALDLETTGLSAPSDEIIEVGAVRFRGERVLDTFESLVNPGRPLGEFIERYTGIRQRDVSGAPTFGGISGELASFIGDAPVVGHNLAFDLGFLDAKGLRLANPRCDTWDLAFVLLSQAQDYSLGALCSSLGITHAGPHRAGADAAATHRLFVRLAGMASDLDSYALTEVRRLAARSSWVLAYFLAGLEGRRATDGPGASPAESTSGTGIAGVDTQALRERLRNPRPLRANEKVHELDPEYVASLLKQGGAVSRAIPGFEERPQQVAMARAVAEAINQGGRLIVEAGTGVGKSLAYLAPAVLYALENNKRVVVSTNTINLQEQLMSKDVPTLVRALSGVEGPAREELRFTQLKGRANYLCMRRWAYLRSSDGLSENDARVVAKVLMWLRSTSAGDRSELNLGGRATAAVWDRLSAQGAAECPWAAGPCFLRSAREKAAAAHLVIVNHALLLSDVIADNALIPPYDVLVIDEAQHLEEQATRHMGFEVGHRAIEDGLQALGGDRGLLREAASLRPAVGDASQKEAVGRAASQATVLLPQVRERVAMLFALLGEVYEGHRLEGAVDGLEMRITRGTRSQPRWSEVESQWAHVDVALAELGHNLKALATALEALSKGKPAAQDGLVTELGNAVQTNADLRHRLDEAIAHPKPDGIYWAVRGGRDGDLSLHAAPLHVGDELERLLYSHKECVVMTSATLSANGTFAHIVERTGLKDAGELLLGSPFDFRNAALLCVPEDMPEPSSPAYGRALQQAVGDAAVAAEGRTMALFTSHASLREVASAVRGILGAHGIEVYAQGVDGTPHQVLRLFVENPSSLLLGTASFWEGVDLAGEALKVLLVARLPFSVPSDPVFAARSELYEEPFRQYAVPQAVLRLRQGFGRLIRTKTDTGVVAILDRRLTSRSYGKAFLMSLPPATFRTCSMRALPREIREWLRR